MSNETTDGMKVCKYCGTENEESRSLCSNCQMPFTAYAGQLRGLSDEQRAQMDRKVARLAVRPPGAIAMTAFDVFFALFWPLAYVIGAFVTRPTVNSEGTNYLAAAFGAIGPFLTALIFVPAAGVLFWIAWLTWSQRNVAWTVNLATVGLFVLLAVRKFGSAPPLAIFMLILAGIVAFLWFRPETKTWYGYV